MPTTTMGKFGPLTILVRKIKLVYLKNAFYVSKQQCIGIAAIKPKLTPGEIYG
jgi:hypothetical protein